MKITRISLFAMALTLSFISCSQEDVSLTEKPASSVNLRTKDGLKDDEVKDLKAKFADISQSAEFLNKTSKAKEFAALMNYNYDESWTKRSDVEAWLNSNLSLTKFSGVSDALKAFDALAEVSKNFYVLNESFYNDLQPATPGQIKIIFEPIVTVPGVPVTSTDSCDEDCLNEYQANLDMALEVWRVNMEFGDYTGNASHYAFAEWAWEVKLEYAEGRVWRCFGECDEE